MIKDKELWQAWEDEQIRAQPANFERNLAVVEAMYEHARALGAFSSDRELEGIETKIRLARVLNAATTVGRDRSGA